MRLLLLMLLFSPALHALDVRDIDAESLRLMRVALLKDDVRRHFSLRIGSFESLDQAEARAVDGVHVVNLRLAERAAAVVIRANAAAEHLFYAVEGRVDCATIGGLLLVRGRVFDGGPERTRVLRLKDGAVQMAMTFISDERESLEGGRYVISTRREVTARGTRLLETVTYALDGRRVDGGFGSCTWPLEDSAAGLALGKPEESAISVTTHCAIARKLERERFNEAALRHAKLAKARAEAERLSEDDTRLLDALGLVSRLQARLRRVEVAK